MKRELPIIACTLPPEELKTRGREIQNLLRQSLVGYAKHGASLNLRFRNDDGTRTAVNDFVKLESECCSFLSFVIVPETNELRLEVSGPPGAEAVLDSLFSLFPLDLHDLLDSRDVPSTIEAGS